MQEWLTAEEVAKHLGINKRTVNRRAMREGWLKKTVPAPGSNGRRHLYHRSGLEPARPEPREESLALYDAAPDWAQAKADARRDLIIYIEEQCSPKKRTKGRKKFLASYNNNGILPETRSILGNVSYATYMRWVGSYKIAGIAGLIPQNKGRASAITDQVKARIRELALEKPRSYAVIHEFLEAEFREACPSYQSVARYAKQIRSEEAEAVLIMHKGPTAHRHATLTALGRSDAKAKHPNHMWEIDTTPADLVDSEGKRWKIFGLVDIYTRRYLFRAHPAGNGLAVAQTIRSGILAWGLPDVIIMDNGLDYQSKRVQTMCHELGITVITNLPYSPEGKPHVERSFRTLSERVFRELTGYTGNSLITRPEVIVQRYTAQEIQEHIDRWVESYWHERVHPSTGKRPREAAGERTPKRVTNERVLDVLLGDVGERSIQQGFIRYRNLKYFHQKLLTLDAFARVFIREDAADVGRLYVYYEGQYICTAEDIRHLGITPEEFKKMQRDKLRLAKAKVAAIKAELGSDPDENFLRFLKAKEAEAPAALPGPSNVVEFPSLERAAGEATPEPPAEIGDDNARPEWWFSASDHYEWIIRAEAAGGGQVTDDDHDFKAEYESSQEFKDLDEYWAQLKVALQQQQVGGI